MRIKKSLVYDSKCDPRMCCDGDHRLLYSRKDCQELAKEVGMAYLTYSLASPTNTVFDSYGNPVCKVKDLV